MKAFHKKLRDTPVKALLSLISNYMRALFERTYVIVWRSWHFVISSNTKYRVIASRVGWKEAVEIVSNDAALCIIFFGDSQKLFCETNYGKSESRETC